MQTDDLIQRLGNELAPVRPLSAPWKRATAWLLAATGYLTAAILLAWVRHGELAPTREWLFVVQQLAVAATAVTASLGAFASVIPGAGQRLRMAPILPAALMMATLVIGCLNDLRAHGALGFGRETDWPCVISLTLGSALLWTLAMAMLRRGAPLTPRMSGALAGVAALSIANIEACLTRLHVFSSTVVVWHGLTIVVVGALFVRLGSELLAWRTPEAG
jgi:hypothetical protein